MDRTAWIAITLCTLGLIGWYLYVGKQSQQLKQQQLAATASPTPSVAVSASPAPVSSPGATTPATATPAAPSVPEFAEKTETLRNDDVELHLTNRGGGIRDAVLLNHIAQDNQRVVLNSKDQPPIGAIVADPSGPRFEEFNLSREPDGGIKCERASDNVTVRKKFFFPPGKEKKDNFLAEMDVDFVNTGAQPYANSGYFVALGSAAPIHPKDYSYYTRLVWCLDGKAKGVDVNWFGGGGGFFGLVGSRAPQPFYQQDLANQHEGLGFVLQVTGRLEESEKIYRVAVDLTSALLAVAPGRSDYRWELMVAECDPSGAVRGAPHSVSAEVDAGVDDFVWGGASGDKLAFLTEQNAGSVLYETSARGGKVERLTKEHVGQMGALSVSRDAKTLAYLKATLTTPRGTRSPPPGGQPCARRARRPVW